MDSRPVGFFDSGLGGVSVLGEAVRLLPCERFIYFGDTAHIPYGDKPPQQVLAYTHAAVDKLVALGCKAIVIACNTATSVAAGVLRQELSMPIIGMEPALKPAELLPGEGHVLVLATRVTLSLPKFHQLMRSYGQHAVPVPCPGLMELVEAGVMDGPEVDALLQKLLRPYAGLRIKAVLEPSDASNTNMSWTVADSSIASIRGSNNRPTVTGKRWGTTTVTGVTQDGGFTATATIKTGNYNKAVQITDLYVSDNKIKIVVKNESNMNITKFFFDIVCYDMSGNPLTCCTDGTNAFSGSYGYMLYEGDSTEHGKFYFADFVQPETPIGCVVMTITGYRADDGYSHTIPEDKRVQVEFANPLYVPALN